ncbi:hypothetical protein HI792_01660 [Ralstonia solanacearum]|nr:hypothetical protein [Ralstonia pseudosolanacearum]QKM41506.1 hypothetical protein HI792_01660 [Ralstonia solanacearum]
MAGATGLRRPALRHGRARPVRDRSSRGGGGARRPGRFGSHAGGLRPRRTPGLHVYAARRLVAVPGGGCPGLDLGPGSRCVPARAARHARAALGRHGCRHATQTGRGSLMAGAAVPLIEAAAARALAALGFGAAAGATGEAARDAIRKRKEAADKAKSSPVAQTDAQTKAQARKKCPECPPDKGVPFTRTFPRRLPWVDYQARICGMPSGPNHIIEWMFNAVRFDGFTSGACLLKEAKAGYDQFFDEWGRPLRWWAYNVEDIIAEIVRQDLAASPKPPVRLEWHWQQATSYRYFSRILSAAAPSVPHHYTP